MINISPLGIATHPFKAITSYFKSEPQSEQIDIDIDQRIRNLDPESRRRLALTISPSTPRDASGPSRVPSAEAGPGAREREANQGQENVAFIPMRRSILQARFSNPFDVRRNLIASRSMPRNVFSSVQTPRILENISRYTSGRDYFAFSMAMGLPRDREDYQRTFLPSIAKLLCFTPPRIEAIQLTKSPESVYFELKNEMMKSVNTCVFLQAPPVPAQRCLNLFADETTGQKSLKRFIGEVQHYYGLQVDRNRSLTYGSLLFSLQCVTGVAILCVAVIPPGLAAGEYQEKILEQREAIRLRWL